PADEVDALRKALGREHRAVEDVDDDRPPPDSRSARVFRLRSTLTVSRGEECSLDLRPTRLSLVAQCSCCRSSDRIRTAEREQTARVTLDGGKAAGTNRRASRRSGSCAENDGSDESAGHGQEFAQLHSPPLN